jgi:hypothetical protein
MIMARPLAVLAVLCGGLWLQMAVPAAAQNWGTYNSPAYAAPQQLSPYLNLGFNQNGLSNYQTLVRPMIDEQESIQRQSASLQKLQRQMRDSQNRQDPRDSAGGASNTRSQSAVRFMHYSHYFEGVR